MTRLPDRALVQALLLSIGVFCLALASGCVARAAEKRDVMPDDELLDEASLVDGDAWQSAPWTRARWIPYPGGGTVTVFHGLGRTPTSVEVYLSADEDDTEKGSPRHSFAGAGNIVTLTGVDDESVSIHNNSRGKYALRLVVR